MIRNFDHYFNKFNFIFISFFFILYIFIHLNSIVFCVCHHHRTLSVFPFNFIEFCTNFLLLFGWICAVLSFQLVFGRLFYEFNVFIKIAVFFFFDSSVYILKLMSFESCGCCYFRCIFSLSTAPHNGIATKTLLVFVCRRFTSAFLFVPKENLCDIKIINLDLSLFFSSAFHFFSVTLIDLMWPYVQYVPGKITQDVCKKLKLRRWWWWNCACVWHKMHQNR